MASVESIGACSLDFEASATDNFLTRKDLTASECTLHSNGLTPSSLKESSRNGIDVQDEMLSKEQRFGIHTYFFVYESSFSLSPRQWHFCSMNIYVNYAYNILSFSNIY